MKEKNVSLSAESIQKYISIEANNLKQQIIDEVKNSMVSVKVDGVSRLDRAFLGFNIQYVKNGELILRTLALQELSCNHTGKRKTEYGMFLIIQFIGLNIKSVILDVLSTFQIHYDQIYIITTDNGSNLLKAIKIISSENGEYEAIEIEKEPDHDKLWGQNAET